MHRRKLYTVRKVGQCEIKTFRDYASYLQWLKEQRELFDVKESTSHAKKE
jgi:hypothetical protein